MLSSPVLFVAAVLLLWFPRRWMRLGVTLWTRKRVRHTREPWKQRERGDPRLSFWEEMGKTRNWFDLLRGVAGSLALFGGHGIEPSIVRDVDSGQSTVFVLGLQVAIVLVGLMVQVVRRESGRGTFFAPVFYLAGIAAGLCGVWAVLFAFILVWAINPMLPNAVAFLTLEGIALAGFGVFLRGAGDIRPAIACLLCLTPVMLSMLVRRPLVVFSRKGSQGGTG